MSGDQTPKEQAAEAAAIRRRWITLGEVLAVAAVVISALTLWNSYSERTESDAETAASRKAEEARAGMLVLTGRVEDEGEHLVLVPAGADRAVQSVTISFPAALDIEPVETLADARLGANTIESAVRRSTRERRPRIPILIEARFTADGELRTATGRYQLGLERRERLIGGDAIRITGLAYQGPAGRDAAAALDRAWIGKQ